MSPINSKHKRLLNKYCKGCSLKKNVEVVDHLACCVIARNNRNHTCPCVNCLVKAACTYKYRCLMRKNIAIKTSELVKERLEWKRKKNLQMKGVKDA